MELDLQSIDFSLRKEVQSLKNLLETLGIEGIEDIPKRKDPNTNVINTQVNTFRDAWFAKLYKQGVEFDSDLIGVIPEGEFKETAKAFVKEFPSGLSAKGAQMDSIARDIKSFENSLKDKNYLDLSFDKEKIDRLPAGTKKTALETAVKDFREGKVVKGVVKAKPFKNVPTDEMVGKILKGIMNIDNKTDRELVLLSLFGTRGEQIKRLKSDVMIAKMTRPQSPFYSRKEGSMKGVPVTVGLKGLADDVPMGPFLKDMLDARWDRITQGGNIQKVSLFSETDVKKDLGKIINDNLFFGPDGKSVLSADEISYLGRVDSPTPSGYTDLRRLVLSWAADKTGDRKLADYLLTHGDAGAGSSDVASKVGETFYFPKAKTPVEKIKAFTTILEQSAMKVMGYNNYQKFLEDVQVDSNNVEIKKYKTFSPVKNIKSQIKIDQPSGDIITGEVFEGSEVAEGGSPEAFKSAQTSTFEDIDVDKRISKESKIENFAAERNISYDEAKERLYPTKGRKTKKTKTPDMILKKDSMFARQLAEDNNIPVEKIENKTLKEAMKIIAKVGKTGGKLLGPLSYIVGGAAALKTMTSPAEAFTAPEPEEGKSKDIMSVLGLDTAEERQKARATYEAVEPFVPLPLPSGSDLFPTSEEKEEADRRQTRFLEALDKQGPLGP